MLKALALKAHCQHATTNDKSLTAVAEPIALVSLQAGTSLQSSHFQTGHSIQTALARKLRMLTVEEAM